MLSWNWKKRSYWDNPPNKLFRPIELKEMLITPIIRIPTTSISKNWIKTIQGPRNQTTPSSPTITETIKDQVVSHSLDMLGRMMINAGRVLLIPEPIDATNPYTWADEALGVVFIVAGSILVWYY